MGELEETKGKNSENKNLREMGVAVRCHTTLDQHQPTPGLSFHCQYIPCTQIIQTVLSIQIHTCIVYTCVSSARYCIVKTSEAFNGCRQPCDAVCAVVPWRQQLEGMLRISPQHTGKILPIHSLSIVSQYCCCFSKSCLVRFGTSYNEKPNRHGGYS